MTNTPHPPKALVRAMMILDIIALGCRIITGVALVVLTVIGGWLVYGRYVLNDTPTWVEQVSLLLVMLIAFLGAAVGVHENTHLSVMVLRNAVPRAIRNLFLVLSDLIMATFGGLIFWFGLELTLFKWATPIPLIGVSEGLRSLPFCIGGALIFLFSVNHLIRHFMGFDDRRDNFE